MFSLFSFLTTDLLPLDPMTVVTVLALKETHLNVVAVVDFSSSLVAIGCMMPFIFMRLTL
jgi:hypothetical protein